MLSTWLRRLGSASPVVLGSAFTVCFVFLTALDEAIPDNALGYAFSNILFLTALGGLFVIVTWYREDDWLAAGVLITLIVFVAGAFQATVRVIFHDGVGPAAIWGAVTIIGAIIYLIIFAPVAGGLVALARSLTREANRQGWWRSPRA